ncbi:MAG TPA: hypothetical protein VOA41_20180 [Candidatus Dormibacteraeota bacterium]|nr:hypothetical protein [Candidatus Dormibacteraeota bacterium]
MKYIDVSRQYWSSKANGGVQPNRNPVQFVVNVTDYGTMVLTSGFIPGLMGTLAGDVKQLIAMLPQPIRGEAEKSIRAGNDPLYFIVSAAGIMQHFVSFHPEYGTWLAYWESFGTAVSNHLQWYLGVPSYLARDATQPEP